MNEEAQRTLHEMLEQKQRQLNLILAIDEIRDTAPDPSAMLSSIVNVLADAFQADLCLICLVDRETRELDLKAVRDRGEQFRHLGTAMVRRLSEWIVRADSTVVWDNPEGAPENLQIMAVPITMGRERLGALLLARADAPFGQTDLALLRVAESQVDSAVIQGYAYYDLQQRNKELETIYRVDRIRDQHLSFDDMLNAVLQELCAAIQAEMGFIMLYNQAGGRLEMRAVTHDDLFKVPPYYEIVDRVAYEALRKAGLVCNNNLSGDLRAVMCIPLILRDEILGVFGVINPHKAEGFEQEDRRLLSAIASQMDTAIFENLERRRLRRVLGRSVDPHVLERLLANPDVDFLKGERATLTVLYADIRGSTELAERTDPELLVEFINDCFGRMVNAILSHEGTLDKFVGDGALALFGAPFPQPDHALRAVRVGLEMQALHQAAMEAWQARGLTPAPIGVGIATGELIAGEMGSLQRSDYTVIGQAANLGARICGVAEPGQVLISQATHELVKDSVETTPITGLQFKGISGEVTVYHVTRVQP